MPTLQQIQEQIKNMDGASKFFGKREIKELPNILWEDEVLEKLVQGLYNNGNGILAATNKRLIFIDKGLLGGLKVEDFPYDKISSIQYQTGIMFGKITIFTSGNKALIDQIDKGQVKVFAEFVRARISSPMENASASNSDTNSFNLTQQLRELAELKDSGILTDEEFQIEKKKLLNR